MTSGLSFNDNVIHLSEDSEMRDVIVNDATKASSLSPLEDRYTKQEAATVGLQLAMFLEQTPANVGGFVNKCKVKCLT